MNIHLENLVNRYPELDCCMDDIQHTLRLLVSCYKNSGRILLCGNGGSAADCDHIVGELMKSFQKKRPLPSELKNRIQSLPDGAMLASRLQTGFDAVSLVSHTALCSAIVNDLGGELIFAQQVIGWGRPGDILLALSTSGNADNVCHAAVTAAAVGMKVVGLSGRSGGRLTVLSDICIRVPADATAIVQDYHLPVYHAICAGLEDIFFPEQDNKSALKNSES